MLLDLPCAPGRNHWANIGLKASKRDQISIGLACGQLVLAKDISSTEADDGLTNNLLRKLPTSSVVEGPPIFIKTIAVGPFELVAF